MANVTRGTALSKFPELVSSLGGDAAALLAELPDLRNPVRPMRLKSAWETAWLVVQLLNEPGSRPLRGTLPRGGAGRPASRMSTKGRTVGSIMSEPAFACGRRGSQLESGSPLDQYQWLTGQASVGVSRTGRRRFLDSLKNTP